MLRYFTGAGLAAVLASAAAAEPLHNTSTMPMPYAPITGTEDASAMFFNPAAIGAEMDLQLVYFHDDYQRVFTRGDLWGLQMGPVGFGLQYIRPGTTWALGDYLKYSIPIGIPIGSYVAIGAGLEIVQPLLNGYGTAVSWNVGILVRPARFIAFALTGDNLGSPGPYGHALNPQMNIGLGLRPFGEYVTISGDFHYESTGNIPPGDFYIKVVPVKGLGIQAGLRTDLTWSVGLVLDFDHVGIGATANMDGGKFAGMNYQARLSLRKYPALYAPRNNVVVLTINEALRARSAMKFDPLGLGRRSFVDLVAEINRATRDEAVTAILLRIEDNPLSLEESEEVARALGPFKARGGRVFAYLDGGGNAEYVLASAADTIFMNPAGALYVGGLKADITFFKGTLELLDVKVQTVRSGKYKSFVERFTRDSASPENLEQLRKLISDFNAELTGMIAGARKLDAKTVEGVLDKGLLSASEAVDAHFADMTLHVADLEKEIGKKMGKAVALRDDYFRIPPRHTEWGAPPRIAILEIKGDIVYGEGSVGWFGMQSTGSAEVCEAARELEESPTVRAVVLRIDSPGGSGLASEIMWSCIGRIKEKKPVVVSMGSMAASGGYYAALPGNYVFADPFTLTGSIGVWALKPNIAGLALKLGITHQTVKLTKGADIFSLWRDLDDEEMARVERHIDGFYNQFKLRVSDGRKLSLENVEKVAQGRVWSAKAALENKLVDGIGGLSDALVKAKQMAGIDPARPVRLEEYPEKQNIFRNLQKKLKIVSDPVGTLKRELGVQTVPDVSAELPYNVEVK
jgi:protease-4